ncbi:MAG TPA: tetratricopeptide repeat protein [Polyangiaceae bacterium]
MPQRSGHFVVVLIALSAVLVNGRALAQTGGGRNATATEAELSEARERYTRGVQLASEANYEAALIEMQRAYALNPSFKILYNLGQIHSHLGDSAAALTNFERYLSEGGSDVPPPRVTEVTQEIARLRPRVASVDLIVKTDGADVLLDDSVIGRSPFHKSVLVNAGKHKFSVSKAGAEPLSRVVALAGEDKLALQLDVSTEPPRRLAKNRELEPQSPSNRHAQSTETIPSAPHQTENSGGSGVWVGWTVTAALGIGTGVAGYYATTKASDLKTLRDSPGATRQSLDDAQAVAFRSALATDVLLGSTLVAGAISLYFTLSTGSTAKDESTAKSVSLSVTPGGACFTSSF